MIRFLFRKNPFYPKESVMAMHRVYVKTSHNGIIGCAFSYFLVIEMFKNMTMLFIHIVLGVTM